MPDNHKVTFAQTHLALFASNYGVLTLIGLFYIAGLALAFTPCCLPLVPILSSLIGGQNRTITTARSFTLSLSYVLGMALTYTIAGALFSAAGVEAQAALQRPWVLLSFAGLFILMAFSMFDLFSIHMPVGLQTRLASLSKKSAAGGVVGVALMGALSALVVTSCVTPALIGALAIISQEGNVVRGAVALFALSLGMGTPLLLIGTVLGSLLPKPGPWMLLVKRFFGVLMLAIAVWVIQKVVSSSLIFSLWAIPFFSAAIVLLVHLRNYGSRRMPLLAAALLAEICGVLILVTSIVPGHLSYSGHLSRPVPARTLHFVQIHSIANLHRAIIRAAHEHRPVVVDFYAAWCSACTEMAATTFENRAVREVLSDAVLLQVNLTSDSPDDQAFLRHFKLYGPPAVLFFDRKGKELTAYQIIGYRDATDFLNLARVALH